MPLQTDVKWSAEQIEIPNQLADIIKKFSKQIIRDQVTEDQLVPYCLNYFAQQSNHSLPYKKEGDQYKPTEHFEYIREAIESIEEKQQQQQQQQHQAEVEENHPQEEDFKVNHVEEEEGQIDAPEINNEYQHQGEEHGEEVYYEDAGEEAYGEEEQGVQQADDRIQPFIICGPTGVGKSAVIEAFTGRYPTVASRAVRHTTRPQQEGEEHGVDYYFVDYDSFAAMAEQHEFVEYEEADGYYFGTSASELERITHEERYAILNIPIQSALSIMTDWSESLDPITVFMKPPSLDYLAEQLQSQGYDDESIQALLEQANQEMNQADRFDYILINEKLEDCIQALETIFDIGGEPQ